MCGVIQLTVDIIIIIQIMMYKGKGKVYEKVETAFDIKE